MANFDSRSMSSELDKHPKVPHIPAISLLERKIEQSTSSGQPSVPMLTPTSVVQELMKQQHKAELRSGHAAAENLEEDARDTRDEVEDAAQ